MMKKDLKSKVKNGYDGRLMGKIVSTLQGKSWEGSINSPKLLLNFFINLPFLGATTFFHHGFLGLLTFLQLDCFGRTYGIIYHLYSV